MLFFKGLQAPLREPLKTVVVLSLDTVSCTEIKHLNQHL